MVIDRNICTKKSY